MNVLKPMTPLRPPLRPRFHREDLERTAARMRENAKSKVRWTTDRPPFVCNLLSRVAAANSTTPAQILSGSQQRNICAARWQVIRELRADPRGFSTPCIGRWLGGLHHSTVLNALKVQAGEWRRVRRGVGPRGG